MWRLNAFYAGKETTKFLTVFFAEFLPWKHGFKRLRTGMWTWQWLGSKLYPVNDSVRINRVKTQWGGIIPPYRRGSGGTERSNTFPHSGGAGGWQGGASKWALPAENTLASYTTSLMRARSSHLRPRCLLSAVTHWKLNMTFAKEGVKQSYRSNLER